MDGSLSPKLDKEVTESELKSETETQASKRRKVVEKTVVRVKIGENAGKLKNEGPPSDFWSWRKYGQKPIKGSPYPRGYYKCSTSKGCSAKKQVERCRTGAAVLIITYTSSHNHPRPTVQNINLTQQFKEPETQVQGTEDRPTTPKQEPREEKEETQNEFTVTMTTIDEDVSEDQFHFLQSPISCPQDIMINPEDRFTENIEKDGGTLNLLLDKEPLSSYPNLMTCSTPKSEENDFFDELEELPTSSVFNSFIRSNLFDERIPAVPS